MIWLSLTLGNDVWSYTLFEAVESSSDIFITSENVAESSSDIVETTLDSIVESSSNFVESTLESIVESSSDILLESTSENNLPSAVVTEDRTVIGELSDVGQTVVISIILRVSAILDIPSTVEKIKENIQKIFYLNGINTSKEEPVVSLEALLKRKREVYSYLLSVTAYNVTATNSAITFINAIEENDENTLLEYASIIT